MTNFQNKNYNFLINYRKHTQHTQKKLKEEKPMQTEEDLQIAKYQNIHVDARNVKY